MTALAPLYPVVEKFFGIQGEGTYTGVPMAFIRLQGCSVGRKVCHHCDTQYERLDFWKKGGQFSAHELVKWATAYGYYRLCLTGGEPLDHDLHGFLEQGGYLDYLHMHIETSGTKEIPRQRDARCWYTCSPKPGYSEDWVLRADEIKVIVGGLGNREGWPTLHDALRWANQFDKRVFLQPRNDRFSPDPRALREAADLVREYPRLRLSVQLHKFLGER